LVKKSDSLLRQLCLNLHENKPGSQQHQSL